MERSTWQKWVEHPSGQKALHRKVGAVLKMETTMPRTRTLKKNGTRVIRAANDNTVPEWRLQAAQVRALRALPEHGAPNGFLLAGDQNAARRGPRAQVEAKATGMTPGEPDLRVYLPGGRLAFIENKTAKGRLSPAQQSRHAALQALGHTVVVVRAVTEADAAQQALAAVHGWLRKVS